MTSAKYPEGVSEFDETGLTPEYLDDISAPFVRESLVKYALELREIVPISFNDTFLVIGQIISIALDESIISADGFLELDKAGSVFSNGIDGYYTAKKLGRYTYAKPGLKTRKID